LNNGLSFQYSPWLLLVCLALAAGYAAFLYYKEKSFEEKIAGFKGWKYLLAAFRFVAVFFLSVLLLSPFLRTRNTQTVKPIVAVLSDNSVSMKSGLAKDTSAYKEALQNLITRLEKKYDVVAYNIGDHIKQGIDYSFTDKTTDLSAALEEINGLYFNQNLGAVVMASDGIYNKGVNPVYTANQATYAIYTVAVGDTTIRKDQKLANVFHNKIAYLNDNFALRVDVEANNFAGKSAKLTVSEIGEGNTVKLLQTKEVIYNSGSYFQSFDFIVPVVKTGVAHYRLNLSSLDGEVTCKNNTRDVYVEVLDGRQKILLVAHSAHPDIAALKAAIETNKNYQLEVIYAENFAANLREYNMVIAHQLPSQTHKMNGLFADIQSQKKPVLFVVGSQTYVPEFNKVQTSLVIKAGGEKYSDVTASTSKDFSLFTLTDKTQTTLTKLPPMQNFFGNYTSSLSSAVLLNQKINTVATDFPLWLFNETGEVKTGVVVGEGIWRWAMHDYRLNKSKEATNELINKTIQFLAVKTDKRPFRVNLAKTIFQDNEAVFFDAQLYNANFELVNAANVDLKIKGEDGKTYTYNFNKTDNAYALNAGFLPTGNYSYTATTNAAKGQLTASGRFSVSPLQLEELRTRADYQVLYQLASQHKGSMHTVADLSKIADALESREDLKPVLYDTFITQSAINLKWIFFLLLALLTAEWGVRKYLGGY
jgi:hypothetical protein